MEQLKEAWKQLEGTLSIDQNISALNLSVYLVLGGFLAMYIRFLYRRCSATPSDTDSFTRVFPLLVIITTAVIAVIKSSLALSLGLVGALSIVRFRAAIKEPEELVYLFLCIAVGLALGAEAPLLAIALVVVSSIFAVGMHATGRGKRDHNLLLTITGESKKHFADDDTGVLAAVESVAGRYSLQRLDIENGHGQVRVALGQRSANETAKLISRLRERLPDCEFSYVNINSTL